MTRPALKFGGLLIIFLITAGPGLSLPGQAETIAELQGQINALNQRAKNLESRAAQYRSIISAKRDAAQTLQNAIALLNARISALEIEINQTETNIEAAGYQIKITELETQKTVEKIDTQTQNIAEVLRLLREDDGRSLLEVMLLQNSFATFLDERDRVITLEARLKDGLDALKNQKVALEAQAEALQKAKAAQEKLQSQFNTQQNALGDQKSEKNSLLARTKGEEKQYQQFLSQTEAEQAALFKEIRALERRIEAQKNFLKYAESKSVPPPGTKIFIWPEANPVVTQGYGLTKFAKRGVYGGAIHNGLDLASGAGTPVMAAADGVIFAAGTNKGWGNWVAVKHANDMVTLYAHLRRPTHLNIGTPVSAGAIIGYEGSTGFSTGSHLHFSVYPKFFTYLKGGEIYFNYDGTLNPLDYL